MVSKHRFLHGSWKSRRTFIYAATGSSVGLGAIWKFPYMVGEQGGGAFILTYLLCLLLVGMPLFVAEVVLGRRARQSPINTIRYLSRESGHSKWWVLIGVFGALSGLLILSYYAVVAGWAFEYMLDMGRGSLQGQGSAVAIQQFKTLLGDENKMIVWQSTFLALSVAIVMGGVRWGLGTAVRWMMPLLFLLLAVMLYYSHLMGEPELSQQFLFTVDFSKLSWNSVLQAMGLAFFTLSLGVGSMMAYGAYIADKAPVIRSLLLVVLLDSVVAIAMAMVVFSVVFAQPDLTVGEGPGLLFVTLPLAFANMHGGLLLGALFFLLTIVAALTSAISLLEPVVAWMVESCRVRRVIAAPAVGVLSWIAGGLVISSFAKDPEAQFGLYDQIDMLSSEVFLPVVGLLLAIFYGWRIQRSIIREELHYQPSWAFNLWYRLVKYISPAAILTILVAGLIGVI